MTAREVPGWLYGLLVAAGWQLVPMVLLLIGMVSAPTSAGLACVQLSFVLALLVAPVLAGAVQRSCGMALLALVLGFVLVGMGSAATALMFDV